MNLLLKQIFSVRNGA